MTQVISGLLSVVAFFAIFGCSSLEKSMTESREPVRRDYTEIERRILSMPGVQREVIGTVAARGRVFPLYALVYPPLSAKRPRGGKNILLSAGMHGDEPAGVYAVLQFLERDAAKFSPQFRFFVFPLVNPVGYEANTLENASGENINRMFFKESLNIEAQLVIKKLGEWNQKYDLAFDLHEIPPYWADEGWSTKDNPLDAYLYETQSDVSKRLGDKMIKDLPRDIEVCQWPKIYGDKAVRGVVSYPEGNGNVVYAQGTTLDAYLHRHFASHTFTTETPIGWAMEKRIRTQLSWLEAALVAIRH